ncbi:vacuole import and degradation [Trypanosoma conorhini]|uniref:Vacuole import and degradation n=1 Tax=Trypanosoma conorhini TaxID=83891 RepID=A0A422PZ33_9TRYP|nr:vacuole import and degradation [Trypanosoma conorhini]RNF23013.1 vacuole import and degradation [Trypanosoma conorhini]
MLRRGFAAMKQGSTTTLFTGCGTLYFQQNGVYEPIGGTESVGQYTISIEADEAETPSRCYEIILYEYDEEVLRQPIGNGLTLAYSEVSVHWSAFIDGNLQSIAFLFTDDDPKVKATELLGKFILIYNRCTYALMTGTSVDSTVPDNEDYEYLSAIATSRLPGDAYEEPMYELDVSHECAHATGRGNVCCTESKRFDRALVMRKERNGIEFQAHAFAVDGFDRKAPEKFTLDTVSMCDSALLDDTERKMLLLSVDEKRLHEVDMEYGKVVKEYELPVSVRSVTHSAHVAGPQPVYTCLANNVAFNMDLRMDPRNNIVTEAGKTLLDYKLSVKKPFTCHATSAAGHLVIGDTAGAIRLYSGPPGSRRPDGKYNPKTAKTLLDTKVPIVSVDVTADGSYVLAVCSKYLLLMRTVYMDEDSSKKNGFMSRMGKNKPTPLRLQPTPQQLDAVGGIDDLNFTSGGFDRFEDGRETCITACSHEYVFTWSFEAAKRAMEDGRACVGETAMVKREVLAVSATVPERVMYMTDQDIRTAPLRRQERVEKGTKQYRYL